MVPGRARSPHQSATVHHRTAGRVSPAVTACLSRRFRRTAAVALALAQELLARTTGSGPQVAGRSAPTVLAGRQALSPVAGSTPCWH